MSPAGHFKVLCQYYAARPTSDLPSQNPNSSADAASASCTASTRGGLFATSARKLAGPPPKRQRRGGTGGAPAGLIKGRKLDRSLLSFDEND